MARIRARQPAKPAKKKAPFQVVNEKNDSPSPNLAQPHYTTTRLRRQVVTVLLAQGASMDQVIDYCREKHQMEDHVTDRVIRQVYAAWAQEMKDFQPYARAAAMFRLKNDLVMMRNEVTKPWSEINRHEKLLAQIEGTLQPIRLTIDANVMVKDALGAILGGMTNEELQSYVDTEGTPVAAE